MRILLDTHIYLWCLKDDKRLSKKARMKIVEATEVFISSASIWEAAIKIKLNKLQVSIDELVNGMTESGFSELPINIKHAAYTYQLPNNHRDPFDRILLSQAMTEPLRFLTADETLQSYSELVELV